MVCTPTLHTRGRVWSVLGECVAPIHPRGYMRPSHWVGSLVLMRTLHWKCPFSIPSGTLAFSHTLACEEACNVAAMAHCPRVPLIGVHSAACFANGTRRGAFKHGAVNSMLQATSGVNGTDTLDVRIGRANRLLRACDVISNVQPATDMEFAV